MDLVATEAIALLKRWDALLESIREQGLHNFAVMHGGPEARIAITSRKPFITDNQLHAAQQGIQTELTALLPQYKQVIWSEPDLRGAWSGRDYIDLYVGHYRTAVIERIRTRISA